MQDGMVATPASGQREQTDRSRPTRFSTLAPRGGFTSEALLLNTHYARVSHAPCAPGCVLRTKEAEDRSVGGAIGGNIIYLLTAGPASQPSSVRFAGRSVSEVEDDACRRMPFLGRKLQHVLPTSAETVTIVGHPPGDCGTPLRC